MIRFVEDIYADFLFDCHIANLRLSGEDWEWYGREEHHIELPERDGGILTPLNSQPLTTYQHWIAGVLQSEVLGKCCFACVPKGVLPPMFEMLRLKWARTHNRDILLATKNRGKMWINDGIENRMIHRSEPIPPGWERGRLSFSEEHRRNIGKATQGRQITDETRAKLKARPNAWIGRKHTEESKQKMREAKQRRKND
jgi:hypothetical protein